MKVELANVFSESRTTPQQTLISAYPTSYLPYWTLFKTLLSAAQCLQQIRLSLEMRTQQQPHQVRSLSLDLDGIRGSLRT
jgi:hypothetical protein